MQVASTGEFDNSDLVARILKLRKEQAGLLGFADYAQWSLDSKMAPDALAVERMTEELQAVSQAHMHKDFEALQALAGENGQQEPLARWDVSFWSERLREQEFDYTDDQLRPYFPLSKVLDGLFGLAARLFGVEIQRADD